MDKQLVGELPDITQSSNDDEIMIITDSEHNQLKKEKVSDFINDFISTDENNGLGKGQDNKLFSINTTNADNITSGTLTVDRLPDSGVAASTYSYPTNLQVNAKGQVISVEEGQPGGNNADTDLSNITDAGKQVIRQNAGGLELCDIGMSLYIDETKGLRRRLNGQVVAINANTQAFLNRLKQIVALYPSLSVTETAWQAAKTASAYGQVGRFVIDEEAGTVRLPAVVNVQGALDLQNLGLTVEAGLPNIEAYVDTTAQMGGETGAFSVGSANQYFTGAVGQGSDTLTFDASESNPIYGNSDTVQPEAVQYPYFIQIATGQETENNIVNELELCNPFVLLEAKYSESLLYNASWLRSNGQWNAKALYVSVYEALQVEYNSEIDAGSAVTLPSGGAYTKRGLPVKLSTEEYTDYDHVLNTSEETFRLALKTMFKPVKNGTVPVVGTGSSLGLTDGTTEYGLKVASGNAYQLLGASSSVNQPAGTTNTSYWSLQNKVVGVSTNPNNSGLSADLTDTTGLYLYFYAGAVSQNAGIVNAGRFEETLVDKTNMLQASAASMPAGQVIDLTPTTKTTYTAPADGYFSLKVKATATDQLIALVLQADNRVATQFYSNAVSQEIAIFLPCKKGQKVLIAYSGTVIRFCFTYTTGA